MDVVEVAARVDLSCTMLRAGTRQKCSEQLGLVRRLGAEMEHVALHAWDLLVVHLAWHRGESGRVPARQTVPEVLCRRVDADAARRTSSRLGSCGRPARRRDYSGRIGRTGEPLTLRLADLDSVFKSRGGAGAAAIGPLEDRANSSTEHIGNATPVPGSVARLRHRLEAPACLQRTKVACSLFALLDNAKVAHAALDVCRVR